MITNLIIFIKAFFVALLFDSPVVRLIIGICLLIAYFSLIYYTIKHPKRLRSIQSLTLDKEAIIVSISYILSIIGFVFVLRIARIGKEIDLSIILFKLWSYIRDSLLFNLLCTLVFYVSLFLILIRILSIIRNQISILYYRIHIYLFRYPFYKQTIVWDTFFALTENYILYYLLIKWFNFYANVLVKRSNIVIDLENTRSQIFSDLYDKHRRWIRIADFMDQHLAIIVILISIICDLMINPYKLTTIFYGLPIAFLYLLFQTLARFYFKCDLLLDSVIHRFLYKPYQIHPEGIIELEEGDFMEPTFINKEVSDSLTKYMLNNFRYGMGDITILDDIHKKNF
jgi:hypothetical protein